jgi:hypothetical protein
MTPKEKATRGLELLEESILDLLRVHPEGLGNRAIELQLGIASDRAGKQTGWLGWIILAGLLNKSQVVKEGRGAGARYRIPAEPD